MKPRSTWSRAGGGLAGILGVAAGLALVWSDSGGSVYRDLELLGQALSIVQDAYVDPVDPATLVDLALRSMVESLDQHSTYLDSQELEALRQESQGTFSGIGVVVGLRAGRLTVVAPVEGTPAARAGIRPGDSIVRIGDEPTEGMSLRKAVLLLRGPEGTDVEVAVRRRGVVGDLVFRLTRETIRVPSVSLATQLDGVGTHAGYVRLATLVSGSSKALREALMQLSERGCRRLVLDLRANPGGVLEEAVEAADLFLAPGARVCTTVGKKGTWRVSHDAKAPALVDWPMVVLVDEGTASGAEILAAAIQDHRRGVVIGNPTFGKGTVQEIRELADGTAVKLTTARWFTPRGLCIDRELGMVDTTVAQGESTRVGIAPSATVPREAEGLAAGLAAMLTPGWFDSVAAAWRAPRGPGVPPEVYGRVAKWVAEDSPLAREFPDSAQALARLVAERHPVAVGYVGRELVRRWVGNQAAAEFALPYDPAVSYALEVLANPELYQRLLEARVEVDQPMGEDDEAE